MSIIYHCILSWDGQTRGSGQFDIPYFDFRPIHGHLVMEDRSKYRNDQEQISKTEALFQQISGTGEISFPVPADNTSAVFGLQDAQRAGGTVGVIIGLLQEDQSGVTKPLRSGMRLVDAKVVGMQPRTEYVSNDSRQLVYLTTFKAPKFRPGSRRELVAPA